MSAASQLLAHLGAVKKLLLSMSGAACFQSVVVSQCSCFEMALQSVDLTVDEGQLLVSQLKDMGWPDDVLQKLLGLVGEKLGKATTPVGKTKLQSFEAITEYFTQTQWTFLLSPSTSKGHKLEGILGHATALGLTNGTEPCCQFFAAFYLTVTEGHDAALAMAGSSKHDVLKHMKKSIRMAVRTPPSHCVTALDAKPSDFERQYPSVYKAAFPNGDKPAVCPLDMVRLQQLAASIPMRSTSKILAPVVQPVQSQSDMAQFAALFRQMMGGRTPGKGPGDIGITFLNGLGDGSATWGGSSSGSGGAGVLALQNGSSATGAAPGAGSCSATGAAPSAVPFPNLGTPTLATGAPLETTSLPPAAGGDALGASVASVAESSQPKTPNTSPSNPKVSVADATALVMASLANRENRKLAVFDDSQTGAQGEATGKAKGKAAGKAKGKAKAQAKSKGDVLVKKKNKVKHEKPEVVVKKELKAEKTEAPKVAKKKEKGIKPHLGVERTRSQVRCRTWVFPNAGCGYEWFVEDRF